MANRGFPDVGRRLDPSHGKHDTCKKQVEQTCVEQVSGMCSVAEQNAQGGWTRVEAPWCESGAAPTSELYRSPFQGGMADSGGNYNVAAYKGQQT